LILKNLKYSSRDPVPLTSSPTIILIPRNTIFPCGEAAQFLRIFAVDAGGFNASIYQVDYKHSMEPHHRSSIARPVLRRASSPNLRDCHPPPSLTLPGGQEYLYCTLHVMRR